MVLTKTAKDLIGAKNLQEQEGNLLPQQEEFRESLRPKVEVPTSTNPVVEIPAMGGKKAQQPSVDTSDLQGMSPDQLQDFFDLQNIRAQRGESLSTDDVFRTVKAGRLLQQQQTPQIGATDFGDLQDMGIVGLQDFINVSQVKQRAGETLNPLEQARMAQAQTLLEAKRSAAGQRRVADRQIGEIEKGLESREEAIQQQFVQQKRDAQEAGERLQDSAQNTLSFSGFGRSTFAAQQQADIQQKVNASISILQQQRDAELALARAEAQGATGDVMEGLQAHIGDLKQRSGEILAQNIELMNDFNAKATASFEEKINNIMQLAEAQTVVDESQLTEQDLQTVDAFAALAIDSKGNLNESLLKQVPAVMLGPVLRKSAEIKGGITPQEEAVEFDFTKVADGVIAVQNPQTGEIEFKSMDGAGGTGVGNVSGIGTGVVTAYGTKQNPFGLDIDGVKGDPIALNKAGKVTDVKISDKGFGNQVTVEMEDGYKIRYAHLDDVNVATGSDVGIGGQIGTIGTTGTVIPGPGGDGSHVDITLFNDEGGKLSPKQVEMYLNVGVPYEPSVLPSYISYMESGKRPTQDQIEELGGFKEFTSQAAEAYKSIKKEQFREMGINLVDPKFLISRTPKQREQIDTDVDELLNMKKMFDDIIEDISVNGLPKQNFSGRGRALKAKIRVIQLFAKGEKQFNLGVLTGPDLTLLENVLPTPGSIDATAAGRDVVVQQLGEARDMFVGSLNRSLNAAGLEVPTNGIPTTGFSMQEPTDQAQVQVSKQAEDIFNSYLSN